MDRDEQHGVWDPSSDLAGAAPAGNPASDPFAAATPADPWAASFQPASPADPWASASAGPGGLGGPDGLGRPGGLGGPGGSWPGAGDGAPPTVAWGDESPTVVWPWGDEQSKVTWGSPPAPGLMDFPAAQPVPTPSVPAQRVPARSVPGGAPGLSAIPVPPRPAPRRRRLILVAGAVLAVLLGTVGVGLALHGGGGPKPGTTTAQPPVGGQAGNGDQPIATPATPPTSAPETTPPSSPADTAPTSSPASSPAPDRQAAALAELERIYQQDRGSVSFHGQYVAQIASKYPGITDKLQTTTNGSHRFEASDILAEYRELSSGHNSSEHPVVLLKSTDYGKRQIINGHFLWVTFALGDFPGAESVKDWCDSEFSDLSTAQRENQCLPRQLKP